MVDFGENTKSKQSFESLDYYKHPSKLNLRNKIHEGSSLFFLATMPFFRGWFTEENGFLVL